MYRYLLILVFVLSCSWLQAVDKPTSDVVPDETVKKITALFQDAVHAIAMNDAIGYGQCWASVTQLRHDNLLLQYTIAGFGGKGMSKNEIKNEIDKMTDSQHLKFNENIQKNWTRINRKIARSISVIQSNLPRPNADIKFISLNKDKADEEIYGEISTYKNLECRITVDEQEWILNLGQVWVADGRAFLMGEPQYFIVQDKKINFRDQ